MGVMSLMVCLSSAMASGFRTIYACAGGLLLLLRLPVASISCSRTTRDVATMATHLTPACPP